MCFHLFDNKIYVLSIIVGYGTTREPSGSIFLIWGYSKKLVFTQTYFSPDFGN